jgi:hypothetical protein
VVVFAADNGGSLPHARNSNRYGALGCYNSQSKIATPNIERLTRFGLRLADAHDHGGFLCKESKRICSVLLTNPTSAIRGGMTA